MKLTIRYQRRTYEALRLLMRECIMRELLRELPVVLLLAWLLLPHTLAAQISPVARTADSLQTLLRHSTSDTGRVRLLNALCWHYRNKDAIKALDYSNQAQRLSQQRGFWAGLAENRNFTGIVYRNLGDYPKAMACFVQAKEVAERFQHRVELAFALNNMGEMYRYQSNYAQALRYVQQGLELFQQLGHLEGQYFAHIRLGEIYQHQHRLDESLVSYKHALAICEQRRDSYRAAGALRRIGTIYKLQNQSLNALNAYNTALRFATEANDNDELSGVLIDMGTLFLSMKRYPQALAHTERGLEVAKRTSVKIRIKDAYQALADIYYQRGQYKQAADYRTLYIEQREQLFSEAGRREVERLSINHELNQKQQQIDMLNQQRSAEEKIRLGLIVIAVISLTFVAVLLTSVIYVRRLNVRLKDLNSRLKEQHDNISRQQTLLEAANRRADEILLNTLPAAIVRRLQAGETRIAESFDAVTVMFADIVGFTKFSDRTHPEVLVALLDELFSRLDELAEQHGLEKIKTIGDAYMVVGGLPERSEDHAERVAQMALAVLTMVQHFAHEVHAPTLHVRIGMHTGGVVAGVIGKKKFAYDLWGDTVNTASRMESHGEEDKIHVSHEVYKVLEGRFSFVKRGTIEVKGKGLMQTWFLTAENLQEH
jgi:class 3 adenylate cyclase/rhodanese-related sulfurtransferase